MHLVSIKASVISLFQIYVLDFYFSEIFVYDSSTESVAQNS